MSKYNSPFIEGSADPQYDKEVDAHWNGKGSHTKPGVARGEYTKRWGSKSAEAEFLNNETGVNHKHNGAKGSFPRG